MHSQKITISFLLLLVFSTVASADKALPEFTATYAIQKFGIKVAEAEYQLNYTDTGYRFSQHTRLHGIASMFRNDTVTANSVVDEIDGRLLLQQYTYKQTGKEKNKNENFAINWRTDNGQLNGNIEGVVRNEAINLSSNTPIWEALSFQLPLMIDADTKKQNYEYNALIKGEITRYNFTVSASEEIDFADKTYQTLHVINNDNIKNRQLHLWLVPELHNLPVIIENYRDGELHSRMQLESVQFNRDERLNDIASDDDF